MTKDPLSQGDSRFEIGLEVGKGLTTSRSAGNLKVVMIPNPTSGSVLLTYRAPIDAPTSIRVLTIEGVCVLTSELGISKEGSVSLGLDNLPSGLYMVEFVSGANRVVQRVVKE